jgi:DNA-directed RNA polymerase alpha subunit
MDMHGGPGNRKRRKKPDPDWIKFMTNEEKEERRIAQWSSVSIFDAGLPMRIANMLESHNIMTVGDLSEANITDLINIHNLGELTVIKCSEFLDKLELPNKLKPKT